MKNKLLRFSLLSVLMMLFGGLSLAASPSASAAESAQSGFRNFAVQLTKADIFDTSVLNFGVKVAEDGSYTATAADAADANFTVSAARYNDADHGWVNCTFTIPVNGPVKIGLGNCQYGAQDGTITDAGNNVTALTVGNANCWHVNMQDNISYTVYKGTEPTVLTVKYNGYCPFISCEAVDAAELKEDATVSFDITGIDCQGFAPETVTVEVGKTVTIPQNFSLYREGYTLTGWAAGSDVHAVGTEMTVNGNVVLTPVFTANEWNLGEQQEPVTVKFNFRRDQGAPTVAWQNQEGMVWVAQATAAGKTIDVAAKVDTKPGKMANGNWSDWCQLNNGTTFTIPSAKGAVVSVEAFNALGTGDTPLTIDGQSDYTSGKTISYTIGSSAETIDVVIGSEGSYYRYIQVVLPKVEKNMSGLSFDNVEGSVTWPVGNEETATVSNEIADAVSIATVAAGSGMTAAEATYFETKMVKYTPANSNSGTVEGVMIEYRVKTLPGLTFKPTNVSYAAVKVGTDNATYRWSYTLDGVESAITKVDPKPDLLRNDNSNSSTAKLIHSHDLSVNGVSDFTFRIYISDCANNKNICIGNVVISGVVNGTVADVKMYSLETVASPEEGGTVSVYPAGEQFEEGSELTLTATENFGYDFINWTDSKGAVLSEEAKFVYTVNADDKVTANFKQVETYELAFTVDGTNDYMVEVSPAPTIVDGKMMYEAGQAVQLTANQYAGLVTFNNWSDGDTNSSKLIQMTKDTNLTAVYSQADIVAGWDFYKTGSNGRKADFASTDNESAALSLVETATGNTSGWLDKSTLADGGYESFAGAAVNWRDTPGTHHWQTKVNAADFTDINVQFQMLYNYNAYPTYNVEYSLDGENWTNFGSITMVKAKEIALFKGQLPAAANNQSDLFIRMIADKTSTIDGASGKDGNTLAMFFITGTPKLVNDGVAPVLVSTVPADGATGASATGKIVFTFDERVKMAEGAKGMMSVSNGMSGTWLVDPVVSGKTITFDYKGLEYGTPYAFTLAANSVADLTDNYITEPIKLSFTTMERPSIDKKLYDFIVPDNGTFAEALKAAAARSDKNVRYRIFVKQGDYVIAANQNAKVVANGDHGDGNEYADPKTTFNAPNVSIIGESADNTSITNEMPNAYKDNQNVLEGIRSSGVLYLQSGATDSYFQDLKLWSATADATGRNVVLVDGGTRNVFKNVTLWAYQDTYVPDNGRGMFYFENGIIRGRTDFICGDGDVFFNTVDIIMCQDGGYVTAARSNSHYGLVFKDCTIKGETSKVDGNYYLGRPWTEGAEVYYIDTRMEVVPRASGWTEMSAGGCTRMAEWNSTTTNGSPVDLSQRATKLGKTTPNPNNPILTAQEALEIGNLHNTFGDWDPTLLTEQAPIPTNVKQDGKKLVWDNSNYALLWAVVKDGKVIAFTTEPSIELSEDGTYAVRAANEMGGLSEMSATVAVTGVTTGISETINAETIVPDRIYNMGGVRVDKAQRGLYIINGRKVVIK